MIELSHHWRVGICKVPASVQFYWRTDARILPKSGGGMIYSEILQVSTDKEEQ